MRVAAALLFVSTLVSAHAAFASDLPTRKPAPALPPPPAAFNWTGFYIGAEVGGAWGQSRSNYPIAGPAGYLPFDPSGAFGGLYAGYNYQFAGNFVVGAEGDVNYGDIRHGTTYHVSTGGTFPTDTGEGDERWFGSARARLGYALDRFLPFVTGGVAIAEYKNTLVAGTNPLFSGSYDHTLVGWTIGGGLEYAIASNLTLRAEYRYADYGHVTDTAAGTPRSVHTTDLSTNDVRIGLAYKF